MFFGTVQCPATGVPTQCFSSDTSFHNRLYIRTLLFENYNILSFVIKIRNTHAHTVSSSSFIQRVMICFYMSAFLLGKDLYILKKYYSVVLWYGFLWHQLRNCHFAVSYKTYVKY